jgi:hypothetical protein
MYGSNLGVDLTFVALAPPLLAMGDPGTGFYDDQPERAVYLVDPLEPRQSSVVAQNEARFLGIEDSGYSIPRSFFGQTITAPGDVTGNGEVDLVVFDTNDDTNAAAFVFEGPLLARTEHESLAHGIPFETEVPWRATPCGDLTGDGVAEICTALGIVHGPVTGPITGFEVSWTPGTPPEDVRVAAADLTGSGTSLLVSDPATNVVHHLTTFPTGAHELATLATDAWTVPDTPTMVHAGGDLDGDGLDDAVIAWGGASPGLAVATGTGGDLATSAYASLNVRAEAIEVADFNGDGADDLAVGGTPSTLLFLGPLAPGPLDAAAADQVLAQRDDAHLGSRLAATDADGDGAAELAAAVADGGGGTVYVFDDPLTFDWALVD